MAEHNIKRGEETWYRANEVLMKSLFDYMLFAVKPNIEVSIHRHERAIGS